jgi:hypothetical protein
VAIIATSEQDKRTNARVIVNLMEDEILVSIGPQSLQLSQGQRQQFTAAIKGTENVAVRWWVQPEGRGSISPDGLYSAPASVTKSETVLVIATSMADATKSAEALISLVASPPTPTLTLTLTLTPLSVKRRENQTQQFTVSVQPANSHPRIRWSITPEIGSISPAGLYTAPKTILQSPTIVQVKALPNGDSTHATIATVTLGARSTLFCGHIRFTDFSTIVLHPSERHQFRVTGADEDNVDWFVVGPGSIDPEHGLYTAPADIPPGMTKVYVKAQCRVSEETERVVNLVSGFYHGPSR